MPHILARGRWSGGRRCRRAAAAGQGGTGAGAGQRGVSAGAVGLAVPPPSAVSDTQHATAHRPPRRGGGQHARAPGGVARVSDGVVGGGRGHRAAPTPAGGGRGGAALHRRGAGLAPPPAFSIRQRRRRQLGSGSRSRWGGRRRPAGAWAGVAAGADAEQRRGWWRADSRPPTSQAPAARHLGVPARPPGCGRSGG
jgi:hypothetical protein